MPDPDAIAAVLGGVVRGNSVHAPTPGHSRGDRGTVVTVDPQAPDGLLVHSFNGGDPLAIKDDLRRAGVLPAREMKRRVMRSDPPRWRETGVFVYDDGEGNPLYRTRRLEADGHGKKFVAERWEDGQWVNGLGQVHRLPYRWTALCKAFEQARQAGGESPVIYFAEGERKADKLASMGFLATAIAFGVNGWREEYGEALGNASVVILPDNDEPGVKFAETVKTGVEAYGSKAVVVDLPGLPPKGDVIDWQGSADDLRVLVEKALSGKLLPLVTLDLAALADIPAKPKTFAVERIAPLGEVTLFTGPGSAGKSLFGQQLATSAAAGRFCLGLRLMEGPALYLTCEDDGDQLHWRQEHICAALGVPMGSLAGKLHLASLRGALDNDLGTFDADGTLRPAPAFHRLTAMIKATGAKLAILDNLAHLFTGNENDRGDVTRFVNLLNRLAGETGAAIILLGHPNKSGDSYSGSTAWLNAVRSQFVIDHDRDGEGCIGDPDARIITVGKANYARKGEALRFRWREWAFVLEGDLPGDMRSELSDVIKANADNAIFLACLRERIRQRRAVSEKHSPTYAPTEFAKMPESQRIGKRRLEQAMDRLFRIGRIERAELWKGDDRKPVFGLRETAGNGAVNTVRETRETLAKGA